MDQRNTVYGPRGGPAADTAVPPANDPPGAGTDSHGPMDQPNERLMTTG
jgi:hypothetical protein